MARIGVIYTAYQAEDLIEASLMPWLKARAAKLGGHEFIICAVCAPFDGFNHSATPIDSTRQALMAWRIVDEIDHLVSSFVPIKETEARGRALRWLVDEAKVDLLWMVDGDEFYQERDILGALAFVESNPLVDWFRLCLRNYVFDSRTYLVDPFTPPRIHRVHLGGYRAHGFWDDNNVTYGGTITRDLKRDTDFASMTVPKEAAYVRHESWLSNERSRAKIAYQTDRWPSSSFSWDDSKGGLIWNAAHFARLGESIPETARDDA